MEGELSTMRAAALLSGQSAVKSEEKKVQLALSLNKIPQPSYHHLTPHNLLSVFLFSDYPSLPVQ